MPTRFYDESKQLIENFSICQDKGKINMNGERMILLPTSVFGTLRKDLTKNLGENHVKGFLVRHGWNLGVCDAKKVLKMELQSIEDVAMAGPMLHMLKGHTIAEPQVLDIQKDKDGHVQSIHMEGIWINSYEAEEHQSLYDTASHPVCHTLIGYASGYLSTILNQKVIFKEYSCEARGDSSCHWVGKTLNLWNGEVDDELKHFEELTVIEELNMTYEKLLIERNNLEKTMGIHKKIMEQIIQGKDLQSVASMIYEVVGIPILISNLQLKPYGFAGINEEELPKLKSEFKSWMDKRITQAKLSTYTNQTDMRFPTECIQINDNQYRLVTPIILRKKVLGYCSFVYFTPPDHSLEIDYMILERVAAVCSLYLLNEQTAFEAEQRIRGHFLEEIILGQISLSEIYKRGQYMNMNLQQPYTILVLNHKEDASCEEDFLYKKQMIDETVKYLNEHHFQFLIGQWANQLVLLLLNSEEKQAVKEQNVEKLLKHLQHEFPKEIFYCGISTKGTTMDQANHHYQEAYVAYKMTNKKQKLIKFESLGVIGILIQSADESAVKKMCQMTLRSLAQPTTMKQLELVKTLYVFIVNGGNLEQTSQDLALSISGLRYRLQKIESILMTDLRNPITNYQLLLAIQSMLYLDEIQLDIEF